MNFFVFSHLFISLIYGTPLSFSFYDSPISTVYKKPQNKQDSDYLSFIVIGDWGESKNLASEIKNAQAMNQVASSSHTSFVVAVGDNFYSDGVTGSSDPKFQNIWESVYTGSELENLPWYVVMGNHDWYGNRKGQIEFSKVNPRWIMPDFFHSKTFQAGSKKVTFLFIDTDLLNYGYAGNGEIKAPANQLLPNFEAEGWVPSSNTLEEQLTWIDERLNKSSATSDYIFVAGHHDLVTCGNNATGMIKLQGLLEKYKVNAYFFGHKHALGAAKVNDVLYVQSGAGGQEEFACSGPGVWGQGNLFGFASVTISGKSVTTDFIKNDGTKLYSVSGSARLI